MLKIRFLVTVSSFGLAFGSAVAQYGYGYQYSYNFYTTSTSDISVTTTYLPESGPYTNGIPDTGWGDVANPFYVGQIRNNYNFATNTSYDYGGPGYSSQFHGINYYIQFMNTGAVDQTFTVTENLEEYNEDVYGGQTVSYGGFDEVGGAGLYGYDTLTSGPFGAASTNDSVNFDTYLLSSVYVPGVSSQTTADSSGSWTDTLTPCESVDVQLWAAGYSQVNSVPSPAAGIVFGLAALCRRRRVISGVGG
jgi:hypothetical protein